MLQENIDYYINQDGNWVFTEIYHLKRGYCCKNKCMHCPWLYGKPRQAKEEEADDHLDKKRLGGKIPGLGD